jgi:glucosylceramidase
LSIRPQFQTFLGIGGALTDASAETFAKLPKQKQREFIDAHFDEQRGIGYKLARTNIHSCDFSSGSYTYVDEGDKELKSFSVAHDKQYRIAIHQKNSRSHKGSAQHLRESVSPPAFMKDNNDILHEAANSTRVISVVGQLLREVHQGLPGGRIPIWGLSIQNEPMERRRHGSRVFTPRGRTRFSARIILGQR